MLETSPPDNFDFKSSPVYPYFENLHSIALRARAILHARTSDEIKNAVDISRGMIIEYYTEDCWSTTEVDTYNNRLKVKKITMGESLRSPLTRALAEEVAEDCFESICLETEVKYLKENINSFGFDASGFKNPTQEELLSAFSLSCIAGCHTHLDPLHIFTTLETDNKFPDEIDPKAIASAYSSAGRLAMLAMDAVCLGKL